MTVTIEATREDARLLDIYSDACDIGKWEGIPLNVFEGDWQGASRDRTHWAPETSWCPWSWPRRVFGVFMKCLRGHHESTSWYHEDKVLEIFLKIFVKISMFLSLITKLQRLAGDGFLRDTRYLLRDHHEVRLEFPDRLASGSGLRVDGRIYNATVRLPKRLRTVQTKVYDISYPPPITLFPNTSFPTKVHRVQPPIVAAALPLLARACK